MKVGIVNSSLEFSPKGLLVEGQGLHLLITLGLDLGIAVAALVFAPALGFVAALLATALCLGRYLAIGAYSRGIDRRRWFFPLTVWIAFYGLLALLLYLSGRKGVILWPALVALSGPAVLLVVTIARAAGAFAPGGPFRTIASEAALPVALPATLPAAGGVVDGGAP
jgi:hypothetical protein